MAKVLTHQEGHVLAIIRRSEPVSAYFVRKALPQSLASSFSDSPGSLYPLIARLQRQGFVAAEPGPDSGRKTELLSCTPEGARAIEAWLLRLEEVDLLPEDPWRTRVLFSDQLAPAARQGWLLQLRDAAEAQLRRVGDLMALSDRAIEIDALESAKLQTEARLVWLDRLLARGVANERGDAIE